MKPTHLSDRFSPSDAAEFKRVVDAVADSVLEMSDEDIRQETIEHGEDPKETAETTRGVLLEALAEPQPPVTKKPDESAGQHPARSGAGGEESTWGASSKRYAVEENAGKYCGLVEKEAAAIQALIHRSPWARDVFEQLNRVLRSGAFGRVKDNNTKRFLAYVTAKSLLGRESDVREVAIGRAVWNQPSYDPLRDNKVRVVASDVRRKLQSYYAADGKDDPIRILIHASSFLPQIRDRRGTILVGTFDNWNPRGDQEYLCSSLCDEIARRLGLVTGLHVSRSGKDERGGPLFLLRGSLVSQGERLRAAVSLSHLNSGQVVSNTIHEEERNNTRRLASEITESILSAVQGKVEIALKPTARRENEPSDRETEYRGSVSRRDDTGARDAGPRRVREEAMLLNILPASVAKELQQDGTVRPMYFEDVTVCFTDFVGFSKSTMAMAAEEVVHELNKYFTAFDRIVERYGLERLKTIGDSYMFVSGLLKRHPANPIDAVLAALEIVETVKNMGSSERGVNWKVRVGLHTGPVIAGVVGLHKFAFDIWGETVNVASRMQLCGEPNRVSISERTFARAKDFLTFEPRGRIKTKEGQEIEMYFVEGVLEGLLMDRSACPPPLFEQRYRLYFKESARSFPSHLLTPRSL